MSAKNKKSRLLMGTTMVIVFAAVLAVFFMPVFGGQNGLDYLDQLYNSISKDSAYYIPDLGKQAAKFDGTQLKATLDMTDQKAAARAALLFAAAGAKATAQGSKLAVAGDLGKVFASSLADSDAMFHNQGDKLKARYQDKDPKLMLYTWWGAYKALEKSLNRQKAFAQAKFAKTIQAKAVEMSYNYYGIEPQSIGDKWLIVVLSLLFYVIYTLWYGYGVMYMFEGSGYQLEH